MKASSFLLSTALLFALRSTTCGSPRGEPEPLPPLRSEFGVALTPLDLGIGPTMDVAASATHLYAIGGGRLVVLELSAAGQPRIVGRMAGLGHVRQIAVQGGIAYITSREDGLYIVDIRRPDRPMLVSHYDTIELATGIAVSGQVAAVANRFAGVELIDVSDPKQPQHLSTVRVGEAQSVAFQGNYLYAGIWASDELAVVDVRNPRQPRLAATATLDGHGDGVAVRGNFAFFATGHHSRARPAERPGDAGFGHGHGLEIFDISDPTQPRFLSRLKFPPFYRLGMDMWGVELAGKYAFVHDTYNGLFVVDIDDPARPRAVAHCRLRIVKERNDPSPVAGLALAGGQVFLAGAWSDLHAAAPGVPVVAEPTPSGDGLQVPPLEAAASDCANVYRPDGQVRAVLPWRDDARGPVLLLAAGKAGLHVVRRSERFELLGKYPTGGFATDVAFHGDRVYVAESSGGLSIWKARPLGALERIGGYEVPGESIRQVVLAAEGTMAFLAVGASRLQVVRLTADGTAHKVLEDTHTGLFYRLPISPVAAADRSVLCQWHVTGLYQYNATGDGAKFAGFHYPHGMGTHCGTVAHGDRWIATSRSGLWQIRAGDTRSPQDIGLSRVAGEDISGKPTLFGETMFVAHPFAGLVWALDIADFRQPKLIGTLQLAEHPGFVRALDGVALVPAGYQGLIAWDYRNERRD